MPRIRMPSKAMHTVLPANSTARPEVSMALTAASLGVFRNEWRHDILVEKIIPAEPGVAHPRCTGGRRDGPPEGYGGIWVTNEQFAEFGDLFTVSDLNKRLAGLAAVLIAAR